MKLQMVGCSHHNSSVEVRERLAFSPDQAAMALEKWRESFPTTEAVLLSTCNRVELYTAADDPAVAPSEQQVMQFLADFHGLQLRSVFDDMTSEAILSKCRLANTVMIRLGVAKPRIAVCALNPHAGEDGLFGDEEKTQIGPAIEDARREGLDVYGPLPADTLFSRARGGEFDIVIAMYHDQGHVPVKTLGFNYDEKSGTWTGLSGVNVTVGLPFLRVSVDHGTAFDRAWKGIANPESMLEAIHVAVRMLTARA